ncbi:MAG: glycosyltransferase family 2 protein, partial [Bdellovibrionales bacterium]|nr:glycosyltransferase family 2 protein [Bdellovibrionales bacterium]
MNQLAPPHSLGSITPVIITFNEQSNLGRTLDALHWAKAIIIVDSGSTDDTIQIAHAYPNTTVHHRPFDSFANQWNHALQLVPTEWALCLDADCIVSPELAQEMNQLDFEATDGYRAPFKYCICGKPLRSSLLPPRVVLVPVKRQHFINDGHFQVQEKQNDIRSLSGYL